MVSDDEHQLATVVVELANAIKSLNESNEKRHLEMVSLLKPEKRSPRRRPDTQRIFESLKGFTEYDSYSYSFSRVSTILVTLRESWLR
jgi:hypothetical protein